MHTPGPWFAYREGDRNPHFRDPDAFTIMQGADWRDLRHTEPIAHCSTDRPARLASVSGYLHPAEANARLIACAPELLRALKDCHNSFHQVRHGDATCLICALIRKAEGK